MNEQPVYDSKEHLNRLRVDKISKKVETSPNYRVEHIA